MADVESEARDFLRELDTFGQPPPPRLIIDKPINSSSSSSSSNNTSNNNKNYNTTTNNNYNNNSTNNIESKLTTKEFARHLESINLGKQQLQRQLLDQRTGNSDMLRVRAKPGQQQQHQLKQIDKDEIQKLKQQVLSASRPLNQWYDHQHQSPTRSSQYARSTIIQDSIQPLSLSSLSSAPLPPPPPPSSSSQSLIISSALPYKYTPINVSTTTTANEDNRVFSASNAIKSSYTTTASLSPLSPASNNTETSLSSLSTASCGANSSDRTTGVYHARPFICTDGTVSGNDENITSNSNSNSNGIATARSNYYNTNDQKTFIPMVPSSKQDVKNRNTTWKDSNSGVPSADSTTDGGNERHSNSNRTSLLKTINGQTTRIIMKNNSNNNNNSNALGPSAPIQYHQNGNAVHSGESTVQQGQAAPLKQVSPPWRKRFSRPSTSTSDDASKEQQRKYEQITEQIQQQLTLQQPALGICAICGDAILDETQVTCALGKIYHQKCFVCDICERTLCGKKFYKTRGKTYCEEDYLYSGMHETAERCAACSHLIVDMVLQALGKSYHPACFRCDKCKMCLDGIPFALDAKGNVYCMNDYHQMFAPTCAACHKPIMPATESGETIRVVAINKDYHIECYVCEGCGIQLTDEPQKRCYPLNSHLLCKQCHIIWAKTGGDHQPITDL